MCDDRRLDIVFISCDHLIVEGEGEETNCTDVTKTDVNGFNLFTV